jgi:type I restriction enzyme S subunit
LYICFRIRLDVEADLDFFRHYFEAGLLNEGLSGIAQEGARNHGLLNVSVADFFKLRLRIPPVSVQRKIARVINAAEAEEKAVAQQLHCLQTEKRALAEQLLTGKRRLSHSVAEAEEIA